MAGPLDGFVTWILLLGNWVQIVLLGCAGYFVYLIAFNPMGEKKSGKEYGLGKGTGKKLWDKGKDAYITDNAEMVTEILSPFPKE